MTSQVEMFASPEIMALKRRQRSRQKSLQSVFVNPFSTFNSATAFLSSSKLWPCQYLQLRTRGIECCQILHCCQMGWKQEEVLHYFSITSHLINSWRQLLMKVVEEILYRAYQDMRSETFWKRTLWDNVKVQSCLLNQPRSRQKVQVQLKISFYVCVFLNQRFQDLEMVRVKKCSSLLFTDMVQAFILYRQHQHSAVVAQNPGLPNPDISKIIGEQWRHLSVKEKSEWQALAEVSIKEFLSNSPLCFVVLTHSIARESSTFTAIPRLSISSKEKW